MGLIARLLSFTREDRNKCTISDVKVDPGGGANITAEHFAPAGDDSHPLKGDTAYCGPTRATHRAVAIGYLDPTNAPQSAPGEKRIYSRDEKSGEWVAQVWLKNDGTIQSDNKLAYLIQKPDGTIVGNNENGSFTLKPNGSMVITNAAGTFTVDASGSIKGQNGGGQFELQASGTMNINGATISPDGAIYSPTGISSPMGAIGVLAAQALTAAAGTIAGVNVGSHGHTGVEPGSGTSGGPTST